MKTKNLGLLLFCTVVFFSTLLITSCEKNDSNPENKKPGVSLGIQSLTNLRDMGGYKTIHNQTIAYGKLYRSNQLANISTTDMQKLAELKLKNSFDMRSTPERDAFPEELPEGVKYNIIDVFADTANTSLINTELIFNDPEFANATFGNGVAEQIAIAAYRIIISKPTADSGFSILFNALCMEEELPALFHCTTGKDRTGWVAAAFLSLMEVPEESIYENYLLSNDYILPKYKTTTDAFLAGGGQEHLIVAILGVKREYLEATFNEMTSRYGTIENYFTTALKIDSEKQQVLKDRFLVD
jgi:protein-tyrosine phosphatase